MTFAFVVFSQFSEPAMHSALISNMIGGQKPLTLIFLIVPMPFLYRLESVCVMEHNLNNTAIS